MSYHIMRCFNYFLLSIHSPALQSLISYLAIFQQERDSQIDYPSAESEGFEPPEQLPVHRISSAARSTTPATFLVKGQACKKQAHPFMKKPGGDVMKLRRK